MSDVILTEQPLQFMFNEAFGLNSWVVSPILFELVNGESYTVTWDGIEYQYTAKAMSLGNLSGIGIGNEGIVGIGENTNAPFIFAYVPEYNQNAAFSTDTEPTTHTVSIAKVTALPDVPDEPETLGVDIVLYDRTGQAVVYHGIDTITTDMPNTEAKATFTLGVPIDNIQVTLDMSSGDQDVTAPPGNLIRSATIKKPVTLSPENIKKNVNVAGVVGNFSGEEVEKTVVLYMEDGDQVIEADEDTVMTKVIVEKPETLSSENIKEGVNIGGVVGSMVTPKLYPPSITKVDSDMYSNLKIRNPSGNGQFAQEMNFYIDGELITKKNSPVGGLDLTVADVSLYNGKDGVQTIGVGVAANGFKNSDIKTIETTMYGIDLTPDTLSDGYDYPAIDSGKTYVGKLDNKSNAGYFPLEISVKVNDEDHDYIYEHDIVGLYSNAFPIVAAYKYADLSVPDVTGALSIDIPMTEQPKLEKPVIESINGNVVVKAPPYAQSLSIYVDGDLVETVQGAQFDVDKIKEGYLTDSSEYQRDFNMILHGASNADYVLYKINLHCEEETKIELRCLNYAASNPASCYGILSNIDTTLISGTGSDATSSIYRSFMNESSQEFVFVPYTVPAGDHFIYAKEKIASGNSGYNILGFNLFKLINDRNVTLSDYSTHTVTAYASAPGMTDSDYADSNEFQMKPTCYVKNKILTVGNIIDEVNQISVYIDGELYQTYDYDGSSDWTVDLSDYNYTKTYYDVYIRAIGDDIDVASESIQAVFDTRIFGVLGLYGSSATALTRTDDAVDMTFTKNTDGSITSDFDDVFPWNCAELVTDDQGNQFVSMPRMYFRVDTSGNYLSNIAVSAESHESGTWYEVKPFWYGRYGASYDSLTLKLKSRTSYTRSTGYTRAQFRDYAARNGDTYHQLDLYHHTVMMFLWWIEFATKNSQDIMTGNIGTTQTSGTKRSTGGTSSVSTPSGYETVYRQMRYHYIEDFIGNCYEFVDGVYMQGTGTSNYDYATADPSKFSDTTTGMNKLSYNCNASASYPCVSAIGWDKDNPFLCTPSAVVNNGSSTYSSYFCDSIVRNSSYHALYVGSAYNSNLTAYGLTHYFNANATSTYTYVGARLLRSRFED